MRFCVYAGHNYESLCSVHPLMYSVARQKKKFTRGSTEKVPCFRYRQHPCN